MKSTFNKAGYGLAWTVLNASAVPLLWLYWEESLGACVFGLGSADSQGFALNLLIQIINSVLIHK